GVFRSEDHGATWQRLGGGLLEKQVDRVALDVAASQPGVVYAMMCDASTPELAKRKPAAVLFRSDDHGDTWQRAHEDYLPTYVGWDFCDLRVAPDDADRVYVGGLRLIVSTDGGKTFQGEGGFAVNRDPKDVFRLHAHRGIGMHLDVHDIWIDPEDPQRVMLGNDGGLYVSWNRGQTWLHLNNLPIAEFYRVHLDQQKPFRIWGGTQDNASFVAPATARFVTGADDSWQQVFLDPWSGGDGFSTFPDPRDPQTTYYTQQNGDLKRSRLGQLRPEKSIRPHSRNTSPNPHAKDPEKSVSKQQSSRLNFAWDTPFMASWQPGDTVLYCAAQCVLRSQDRGDSWTRISPDLGSRGLLALTESPRDALRLAAGGGRGNVHVTSDAGQTWKAIKGLPKKVVRDILCCPHNADRLFVALSGKPDHDPQAYLFMSEDFGETWLPRSNGLPAESINALAADPTHPGLLFAGTDLGVYVSLDHGETWHSLCQSLPTAPVVDLAVHGADAALVAATHGLGIFLLDIGPIQEAASRQK
ncbi:MAG: hypothetical protein P8J33_07450, partial [Pirellulaceae bacterium]|nr:hypothetical protein [Pirellulaceae bacterium]